jgi:hypothetical protein
VTPYGGLIAVPERGTFLGFRGVLHDKQRNLVRYSSGKAWAICAVEFKGRRRPLWAPGRLSELFFLDEAAGHRPCESFKLAWSVTHPGVHASAATIDDSLHADRSSAPGTRRTFTAALADLADGVMVDLDDRYWLVSGDQVLAWSPGAYGARCPRQQATRVTVITPRTTVAILAVGYRSVMHPSALAHPSVAATGAGEGVMTPVRRDGLGLRS